MAHTNAGYTNSPSHNLCGTNSASATSTRNVVKVTRDNSCSGRKTLDKLFQLGSHRLLGDETPKTSAQSAGFPPCDFFARNVANRNAVVCIVWSLFCLEYENMEASSSGRIFSSLKDDLFSTIICLRFRAGICNFYFTCEVPQLHVLQSSFLPQQHKKKSKTLLWEMPICS